MKKSAPAVVLLRCMFPVSAQRIGGAKMSPFGIAVKLFTPYAEHKA